MEDLTGLGKIAESEIAKRTYDEGLSGAVQEVGKAATDIVKGLRLFTAPLQLMAAYQDRLTKYLDTVRERVPPEKQQEAAPEIAGPVMRALVFVQDDSPLVELYLSLLERAIDKERATEAHPAFPHIIEQLSPDEALVLLRLAESDYEVVQEFDEEEQCLYSAIPTFPTDELAAPQRLFTYLGHLESLNLVWRGLVDYPTEGKDNHTSTKDAYQLSVFGSLFALACMPVEEETENDSNSAK